MRKHVGDLVAQDSNNLIICMAAENIPEYTIIVPDGSTAALTTSNGC